VRELRLRDAGEKLGGKGCGGGGQRLRAGRDEFGRFGKSDGVALHGFPGFVFVLEAVFGLEFVEGLEQELGDEGEVGGDARRDAVLRDGFEELAEDEVDVGGGHEAAGERGGKLRAEAIGFEKLTLGAGVENAERGMVRLAQHAAGAAVSERELAEGRFIEGGAGTRGLWFRHDRLLRESKEKYETRNTKLEIRKTKQIPRLRLGMMARGGRRAPRGVLDVWQTKDLQEGVFGSVASKGLTGRFFGSVANKRLISRGKALAG